MVAADYTATGSQQSRAHGGVSWVSPVVIPKVAEKQVDLTTEEGVERNVRAQRLPLVVHKLLAL
jgi:hypothetical protein